MSKVGIRLKINVDMIDKARLFRGNKGTYLDATAFVDLDQLDQYGNSGMITQDVAKTEKDAGVKGAILGNARVFWRDSGSETGNSRPTSGEQSQHKTSQPTFDNFDDDIPF